MCHAYSELSTCRPVGMAIGPIPITAMWEWCDRHDLDRDVADHVVAVLRRVDAETMRREQARSKAESTRRRRESGDNRDEP